MWLRYYDRTPTFLRTRLRLGFFTVLETLLVKQVHMYYLPNGLCSRRPSYDREIIIMFLCASSSTPEATLQLNRNEPSRKTWFHCRVPCVLFALVHLRMKRERVFHHVRLSFEFLLTVFAWERTELVMNHFHVSLQPISEAKPRPARRAFEWFHFLVHTPHLRSSLIKWRID